MPRAKGTVQPYPWLPVDWSNLQQDGAKHRLGDTPSCWTGLGNWLSNVACTESPGGLVRTDFWARCQTANSVSVGLGLWLCISNKGPGTADAASGTTGLKETSQWPGLRSHVQPVWSATQNWFWPPSTVIRSCKERAVLLLSGGPHFSFFLTLSSALMKRKSLALFFPF